VVAIRCNPKKIRPIAGNDRPFLFSPCGSVVEALGVWEGASTNGLGTVGGLGYILHSMRDTLRNLQCRISAPTTVANFWEVSASGIQKRISGEMSISRTGTLQADLLTVRSAPGPGPKCS